MELIVDLLGGLGLFLFGMNFMSQGLQKAAGAKLRTILEAMTKNKIIAFFARKGYALSSVKRVMKEWGETESNGSL